jgi:hypothetical protein
MTNKLPIAITIALVAATATARADDAAETYTADNWPTSVILRPLTLAKNMLEIRGATVEAFLGANRAFKPVELSPAVFYGIADGMTIGVTHGNGVGGVYGAPATSGICLTGTGNGCPNVYNNINVEAYHRIARGKLWLATHPSLEFPSFSPDFFVAFRVAVTGRYRLGDKLAVLFDPGVLIGFNGRGQRVAMPSNGKGNATELISVPVQLEIQPTPQLEVALITNLVGSVSDPGFGDSYRIPLGAGATFALNHKLDVGGDFIFTNVLGKQGMNVGRLDERVAVVRVAFRN